MTMLADTLGNVFFAGTCVGAVGWIVVAAHLMGWIEIPVLRRKP